MLNQEEDEPEDELIVASDDDDDDDVVVDDDNVIVEVNAEEGEEGGSVAKVRNAVCPRMDDDGTAYCGASGVLGLYHHLAATSDCGLGRLAEDDGLNSWKSTGSYTCGGSYRW